MKYLLNVSTRDFLSNDDFSVFNTHLTWIFMDMEKIPKNFFQFFSIDFLSINGFYLKCILIVTKGNFNFLLELIRGERDNFSGRDGILLAFNCFSFFMVMGDNGEASRNISHLLSLFVENLDIILVFLLVD